MKFFLLFLLIIISVICFAGDVNRGHRVQNGDDAIGYGDVFEWQTRGPKEFIEFLKNHNEIYFVQGRHYGWIYDSDLPELAKLVDSSEPCAPVVMTICAIRLPEDTRSTVGQEALFLIDGFRRGFYPPSVTSIGYSKNKKEIMEWLKKRFKDQKQSNK